MSSKFWADEKLFETEIGYDVIIYAGEEPNVKEIHAHSNILCIRSQYFRSAFSNEWAEKRNGKFIFRKPNISPQLFSIILRFIYCGNIELKNLQGPDILKLLIAVDELSIHSLISHIQEFLIEHQTEFLHQNPIGILETVYHQHEIFTDLWNFCLKILFSSDEFINLKAPLLELLLKSDDLNVDEIEIWESLLKWCFAQQNIIKDDSTKWNKEDIAKIERSLHKFIPLIRFYDIEPTDFFYKVYCYKDFLPQDLIHDLLEFHIVPNMKPKINIPPSRRSNLKFKLDSNLIGSNHIPLFASWIDKNYFTDYNKENTPYEFKLLYRSSQGGFNAQPFRRNCHDEGATIWIAKIQGSAQLVGGYNSYFWSDGDWYLNSSFIFNFTNGRNISTARVGYINDIIRSSINDGICSDGCNNYGPHMLDLYCSDSDNWSYNNYHYYPAMNIPEDFTVDDYEVFQVIKNEK